MTSIYTLTTPPRRNRKNSPSPILPHRQTIYSIFALVSRRQSQTPLAPWRHVHCSVWGMRSHSALQTERPTEILPEEHTPLETCPFTLLTSTFQRTAKPSPAAHATAGGDVVNIEAARRKVLLADYVRRRECWVALDWVGWWRSGDCGVVVVFGVGGLCTRGWGWGYGKVYINF